MSGIRLPADAYVREHDCPTEASAWTRATRRNISPVLGGRPRSGHALGRPPAPVREAPVKSRVLGARRTPHRDQPGGAVRRKRALERAALVADSDRCRPSGRCDRGRRTCFDDPSRPGLQSHPQDFALELGVPPWACQDSNLGSTDYELVPTWFSARLRLDWWTLRHMALTDSDGDVGQVGPLPDCNKRARSAHASLPRGSRSYRPRDSSPMSDRISGEMVLHRYCRSVSAWPVIVLVWLGASQRWLERNPAPQSQIALWYS
jgi:hypothetical protein